MKRIALFLSLVLLFVLAACDTMGPLTPQQEVLPETAEALPTSEQTGEQPDDTTGQPGADLQGVAWEWVSLIDPMGQTTALDPTRYTLTFNADGTANIKADCNNGTANFLTDGLNLELVPGAITAAACPEDTQDQLFLNSISAAESYVVQDGELFITMRGNSGTIVFRPATGQTGGDVAPEGSGGGLTGVMWQWTSTTTAAETIEAADPAKFAIIFNADGSAGITADCNVGNAQYTAGEDGAMSITLGVSTLAFCGEESQDQTFRAGLEAAESFSIEGGELVINLTSGSGTMRFRNGGAPTTEVPAGPALTGVAWQWVSTTTPSETVEAADPTRFVITFNEDGSAGIVADCNVGGAEYTSTPEGALSITLGVSTLAFCGEESQDQVFRSGLEAAESYLFEDDSLVINMAGGTGAMRFQSGGAAGGDVPVSDDTLTGVAWQWLSTTTPTETIEAADPARFVITFAEDGTAGIVADCNVGGAEYTSTPEGALSITLGVSTLAFCGEESQDQVFRTGLEAAESYLFEDGELVINLVAEAGTMRFRNGGAADAEAPVEGGDTLTVVTWEWVKTVTPVEEITAADPTRYNIVLNADGTASIKADCNVGTAIYSTAEDSTITITPGAMTLALCPEDSQATQFMSGLSSAAIYFFQDGNLLLDLFASSGTMHFRAAGGGTSGQTGEAGGATGGEGVVTEPGKGPQVQPIRPSEITGLTWNLQRVERAAGTITINDPTRYTILFNADGTANVQADCNVGNATYTTGEDGALTITPGASTMAFCGMGSFDQAFLGGLTNAMSYRLDGNNLIIDMLYESGSMVFFPSQ